MISKNCAECNNIFQYEPPTNYPDKRKYCDPCSNKKAEEWNAKQGVQVVPKGTPVNLAEKPKVKAENGDYQQTVYNRTVAANSYEVGRVGNRFKLYFETVEELQAKIRELKDSGLWQEDIETQHIK